MFFNTIWLISFVPSWHYQLPFLKSGRFPGKMNCAGHAAGSWESLCSDLKFETEIRTCTGSFNGILKCKRKSSLRGRDGFCFEVCLNAVRLLRPNPILIAWKSTTLEIRQLVVSTWDNTFIKIVSKCIFAIKIGIHCPFSVLSMFKMCHLEVADPVGRVGQKGTPI